MSRVLRRKARCFPGKQCTDSHVFAWTEVKLPQQVLFSEKNPAEGNFGIVASKAPCSAFLCGAKCVQPNRATAPTGLAAVSTAGQSLLAVAALTLVRKQRSSCDMSPQHQSCTDLSHSASIIYPCFKMVIVRPLSEASAFQHFLGRPFKPTHLEPQAEATVNLEMLLMKRLPKPCVSVGVNGACRRLFVT